MRVSGSRGSRGRTGSRSSSCGGGRSGSGCTVFQPTSGFKIVDIGVVINQVRVSAGDRAISGYVAQSSSAISAICAGITQSAEMLGPFWRTIAFMF